MYKTTPDNEWQTYHEFDYHNLEADKALIAVANGAIGWEKYRIIVDD